MLWSIFIRISGLQVSLSLWKIRKGRACGWTNQPKTTFCQDKSDFVFQANIKIVLVTNSVHLLKAKRNDKYSTEPCHVLEPLMNGAEESENWQAIAMFRRAGIRFKKDLEVEELKTETLKHYVLGSLGAQFGESAEKKMTLIPLRTYLTRYRLKWHFYTNSWLHFFEGSSAFGSISKQLSSSLHQNEGTHKRLQSVCAAGTSCSGRSGDRFYWVLHFL